MRTGNADYIRHIYCREKKCKSNSVYKLVEVEGNHAPLFPELIRIERFNGRSNSTKIEHYLRIRTTTNWQTCKLITGLRDGYLPYTYYGDVPKDKTGKKQPESLLLFQFADNGETLVIDYFRKFYPFVKGQLLNILQHHQFKY